MFGSTNPQESGETEIPRCVDVGPPFPTRKFPEVWISTVIPQGYQMCPRRFFLLFFFLFIFLCFFFIFYLNGAPRRIVSAMDVEFIHIHRTQRKILQQNMDYGAKVKTK